MNTPANAPSCSALLLLATETPLHAGTGQSTGGIDLPIQREAHTRWPCVFGSAVKGALRAHAAGRLAGGDLVNLFGPDHGGMQGIDESHAGALLVGDAVLLALPARSLQSHFKWVSCPAALTRLARALARLGLPPLPALPSGLEIGEDEALTGHAKDKDVFLEELRFTSRHATFIGELAQALADMSGGGLQADALKNQFVIVHDDAFAFITQNATPVHTHVALDSATKTVKPGALWTEETLPPETLLYVPVTATASRKRGASVTAQQALKQLTGLFPAEGNWLQLGGNETTGMGWCRVGVHADKSIGQA